MHTLRTFTILLTLLALVVPVFGAIRPSTAQEGDSDLVASNNAFAFDLYRALDDEGDNLIVSPYSISLALAMTYAGARGDTATQMAETLHFTLPQAELHHAFGALDASLPRTDQLSEEPARPGEEQRFALNIANALWGQADYPFLPDFLALLDQNYRAGLQEVDFIAAPEDARETINAWISDQTQDRIRDLLTPGSITTDTRLVLTNAIYFNAAWINQFEESLTEDGPFTLLDGTQVTVPMMFQQDRFGYMGGDGFQAVTLVYQGGQVAMTVLLPDEGTFNAFEDSLDAALFADVLAANQYLDVRLTMPRYEYETRVGLKPVLAEMGMPLAFSADADFSGIAQVEDLMISDAVHKAFIKVDEQGTEAAAATAIMAGTTSAPAGPPPEVRLDRPFITVIHDRATGTILFAGRVLNPAE